MQLGGVILVAGMVLTLSAEDYDDGAEPLTFTVKHVIARTQHWVTLDGLQRPSGIGGPWRTRRIDVRIDALKRCLALLG